MAEEAGVYIGIHPDDPPVYPLGGIPRPIFGTFEGYRRAIEIAASPNIGMCLCVGCWLEGGAAMGKDVIETIHYFGGAASCSRCISATSRRPCPRALPRPIWTPATWTS